MRQLSPMIKFKISISNRNAEIIAIFPGTREYCQDYLTDGEPDFSVTVTPEDIAFERIKAAREDELEGLPIRHLSDELLELTALQRKITECLFAHDTLLFHGSVVAVDAEGFLFTAKSGTGKSTHTRLWREVFGDRAVMVNDDKPFLRIGENAVTAYGSPWMGKHGLGANLCVPLRAICILERGEENRIEPISAAQALPMLFQQSQRPGNPANLPRYMDLVDALAERTAFYRMQCNMDPEAAVTAYRGMTGKEA